MSGKIYKVYCNNFVTYCECEFYPKKYLNVILGPNGTGKSTLVSAIVLCLGGEPKLLDRSHFLKDYVKSGCQMAKISVELYRSNKNTHNETILFTRTFDIENKSTFYINNETISKKDYLNKVASYNIQIANLCQFLPQDRVQDFAKMNPQEILVNTISSVCSEDVAENFKTLKEMRSKQKTATQSYEVLMQDVNDRKIRLDKLTEQMQQFELRKNTEEKVTFCKLKERQLRAKELKKNIEELTKEYQLAKTVWENHEKECNKMKNEQSKIENVNKKLNNELNQMNQQFEKAVQQTTLIGKKIEQMERGLIEEKSKLERCRREQSEYELELKKYIKLRELSNQELQNLKKTSKMDDETTKKSEQNIERFMKKIRSLNQDHIFWGGKLDESVPETQSVKRQLEELENASKQKLEMFKRNLPDVHKAIEWIKQTNNVFKAPIYKPIMMEISVRNSKYAMYLENTIGFRDLVAFCCESKEDMSLLTKELCVKQNLCINIAHVKKPSHEMFKPKIPIEHLRQYGFEAYLINLIDGPPAILGYLCSLYNLHNIPTGNEKVSQFIDDLPKHIRFYFSGNKHYTVLTSKYSDEVTLIQSKITNKGLLSTKDESVMQNLNSRYAELVRQNDNIRNKRSSIEAALRQHELLYKKEINIINEIKARKNELKAKEDEIRRSDISIETIQQRLQNIPVMENKYKANTTQTMKRILETHKEKFASLKLLHNSIVNKNKAKIKIFIFKQQNIELMEKIHQTQNEKNLSEDRRVNIERRLENVKNKYSRILEEVRSFTTNGNPMHDEFYQNLPDKLDDLKNILDEHEGRLECLENVNQKVIEDYNQKLREIEALENTIQTSKNDQHNIDLQIRSIFTNWFPAIQKMVDTIAKHFSDYMQSMGYVGDIQLIRKEPDDFDSYGVEILVQYRKNVPLQALNRHVQSGGERAVAIAVYTLSLQHITKVPFRCVDEINQGMDAQNERKIWNMLVNETTKTDSSQYFFVTPKILRNLQVHERMMVHIVHNGQHMQPSFPFNV